MCEGGSSLRCLTSLPWTKRTAAASDLARARALLDAGHVAHGPVTERVLDYVAVRLAPRSSLAPVVDGYMRCLSANCTEWRAVNPVPAPDGREHGYPRTALLELAREMRQASAARGLGSLGLVGGA